MRGFGRGRGGEDGVVRMRVGREVGDEEEEGPWRI